MTNPEEARKARSDADKNLRKQRSKWTDVERMVASLRKLREENHFSEMISEALGSEK